ncbi:MAG: hypothetical protein QE271_07450 [Bacteriovoracaceae bacterium]|nr:hypothetical protein [Bacteriovoracaceae bacterium]
MKFIRLDYLLGTILSVFIASGAWAAFPCPSSPYSPFNIQNWFSEVNQELRIDPTLKRDGVEARTKDCFVNNDQEWRNFKEKYLSYVHQKFFGSLSFFDESGRKIQIVEMDLLTVNKFLEVTIVLPKNTETFLNLIKQTSDENLKSFLSSAYKYLKKSEPSANPTTFMEVISRCREIQEV